MKCKIPQISWHNRDPILSLDFQPGNHSVQRLATSSTDNHIFIWYVSHDQQGLANIDFAADLERHTNSVNVIRFSKPNGELLASADCEASIFIWKQNEKEVAPNETISSENPSKETWVPIRTLRGHIDDICDLSWSSNGNFLASASVDNSTILWEAQTGKKYRTLTGAKSFVQGVTIDPLNKCIATLSSDRYLRIYHLGKKNATFKLSKAKITTENNEERIINLFHDNTMRSFCRRLTFSPDGKLLICPSGIYEDPNGKITNTVYVFTRNSLKKPSLYYPIDKKSAIAVACCPILFTLRNKLINGELKQHSLINLPYRIVFAVLTQSSLFLYDTQQTRPFGYVTDIHYAYLSDLSWSVDGRILMVSSVDGYCSVITFEKGEIGDPYDVEQPTIGEEELKLILEPDDEPLVDDQMPQDAPSTPPKQTEMHSSKASPNEQAKGNPSKQSETQTAKESPSQTLSKHASISNVQPSPSVDQNKATGNKPPRRVTLTTIFAPKKT